MISAFRRLIDTWPVRVFFILMVGSFVVWGVGDMLRVVGTSTWIAKVGDTTIEPQTFDPEYRRALQAATQNLPSGQEASAELRRATGEQALNALIGRTAMSQALRDLRIVVPDDSLAEAVRDQPAFKGTDGKFDKTRFEAIARANGLTEPGFLELIRGDMARRELMDAVTAGSAVPDAEAKPIFAMEFEKRSADMAAFPIAGAPEPPVPDEAAARRWYDNHPDLYGIPEYRRVKVAVLSPALLAAGIQMSDQDLQSAYEQHLSEYTTVAKRSAEVISVPDEAKAADLAAKWRAGADWPAMQAAAAAVGASAITEDNATATEFPDPDLARTVFAAAENTVSPAVKGALGWFVVRVTQIAEGGTQPFDAVKDALRERQAREKALDIVYDRANKIDAALGNGLGLDQLPADLDTPAAIVTVDKQGDSPDGAPVAIPGEPEIRPAVLAAAFEAQKGDPPHLTEVQTPSAGGSGYFALSVEDIQPPGTKPYEAVRAQAVEDLRADLRRHTAEAAAAGMLAAAKAGKPFSDAARDAGITPLLSPPMTHSEAPAGVPREVQQAIFALKQGEPTMVETPEGFVVATPVEILAPDPAAAPADYARLKQALSRTVGQDLGNVFAEALRLRANPRINRQNLDQIVQP